MGRLIIANTTSVPAPPPTGYITVYPVGGQLFSIDDLGVISPLGISVEQVEDIVGGLIQNSPTLDVIYDDVGNMLTLTIDPTAINTSDLNNDADFQTGTEVDSAILAESNARAAADAALQVDIDNKADATDLSTLQTEVNANTLKVSDINHVALELPNVDNTSDVDKPVSTAQAAAISTAITAHEAAADPHSQYLTQPEGDARYIQILPNQVLRYPEPTPALAGAKLVPVVNAAGTDYEFFREYFNYASRDDALLHQATGGANGGFITYMTFTPDLPEAGEYELKLSFRWSINSTTVNFLSHIRDGNGDFIFPLHLEGKDSAGIGIVVNNSTGGTTNTGTDQFDFFHREQVVTLPAGTQTFILEFRGQTANQEPTIYDAYMSIKRVRIG